MKTPRKDTRPSDAKTRRDWEKKRTQTRRTDRRRKADMLQIPRMDTGGRADTDNNTSLYKRASR